MGNLIGIEYLKLLQIPLLCLLQISLCLYLSYFQEGLLDVGSFHEIRDILQSGPYVSSPADALLISRLETKRSGAF